MSLAIYFTSYAPYMFRTLIYPSSGACDYAAKLPTLIVMFLVRCVLDIRCSWVGVVSVLQASAASYRLVAHCLNPLW